MVIQSGCFFKYCGLIHVRDKTCFHTVSTSAGNSAIEKNQVPGAVVWSVSSEGEGGGVGIRGETCEESTCSPSESTCTRDWDWVTSKLNTLGKTTAWPKYSFSNVIDWEWRNILINLLSVMI